MSWSNFSRSSESIATPIRLRSLIPDSRLKGKSKVKKYEARAGARVEQASGLQRRLSSGRVLLRAQKTCPLDSGDGSLKGRSTINFNETRRAGPASEIS